MAQTLRRPKWDSKAARERAAENWRGVPSFVIADDRDRKVGDHPLDGVSVYEEELEAEE
jgi:hypothetical protein